MSIDKDVELPKELPGVRIITAKMSQADALWQCPLTGFAAAALALSILQFLFPDSRFVAYFKPAAAFVAFVLTTWVTYRSGLKNVPVLKRAISLFLGKPEEDRLYEHGDIFMYPLLRSAINVPGNSQIFTYTVKPDMPIAKDKIRVIVGDKRRAVILMRVYNPFRYIAAQKPGIALEAIFST